jgi:hypothetical protein
MYAFCKIFHRYDHIQVTVVSALNAYASVNAPASEHNGFQSVRIQSVKDLADRFNVH